MLNLFKYSETNKTVKMDVYYDELNRQTRVINSHKSDVEKRKAYT